MTRFIVHTQRSVCWTPAQDYLICLLRGVVLAVRGGCSPSTLGGLAARLLVVIGGGSCEPPVATPQRGQLL